MRAFHLIGILTTLAAAFSYLNYRFLRQPPIIGLMLLSLIFSGVLVLLTQLGLDTIGPAQAFLVEVDFNELLLQGILSFLLFAGSLSIDRTNLMGVKLDIAVFSILGTLLSTFLVGLGVYGVSQVLGLNIRLIYGLIFGALISPTDPVAVLNTLRGHGVPAKLRGRIEGEALFNDGIGIVLFLSLLALAVGRPPMGPGQVVVLFIREAAGGIGFGLILGWVGYLLIKSVDNYQLEILLTLAIVTGGYSLANVLEISGPLAMVVASLLIGGRGRALAMSEKTRRNLDRFWELVEQFLNAILFTLMGLGVLALMRRLVPGYVLLGAIAIGVVLVARFVSVGLLSLLLRYHNSFEPGSVLIMTWSGARGGIPIALALSIPYVTERNALIVATYMVAVFSILVQGMTLRYLIRVKSAQSGEKAEA